MEVFHNYYVEENKRLKDIIINHSNKIEYKDINSLTVSIDKFIEPIYYNELDKDSRIKEKKFYIYYLLIREHKKFSTFLFGEEKIIKIRSYKHEIK